MTSISKGNAKPHKMALLWQCLPDPGGPFCVGPVHLYFIEAWGWWWFLERLCNTHHHPPTSIKCRCTGPTQKGPPGSGRHGQRRAILSGFALPFEMLVMGYFFQLFSNVLEGVRLCHNVMLCHEQLKDCYEVSRTFHRS